MDQPTRGAADPWTLTTPDLYDLLRERAAAGDPPVVVTVVDVEGSAYRRPGAKMAVDPDGEALGAVTPGCLEGPIADIAADVREAGEPRTKTFDLTAGGEWDVGLGCNGVVTLRFESVGEGWLAALDAVERGEPALRVVVVDSSSPAAVEGDEATLDASGEPLDGAPAPGVPPAAVREAVRATGRSLSEFARRGRATVAEATVDGHGVTLFLDGLAPAPTLLVFGSQGDVGPVVRQARTVGFRVVVASNRGARADSSAFPDAHEVRAVRGPELASAVEDDERTHVVLMSHDFAEDSLALESVLGTDVPYVGLMGPRKRFESMRDLLRERGADPSAADLERVSTPVGLDLGGGEPAQIALSVVAEALAVANGRDGGRLSTADGPIHPR